MSSLPCGGCPYCRTLQSQWGRFEIEVDYVVPLVERQVNSPHNNTVQTNTADDGIDGDTETNYMNQISSQQLRDAQLLDGKLCPVINWLEGEPPPQNDFHTKGIETRTLWTYREQLRIVHLYLYYRWVDDRGISVQRLVVPHSMKYGILQMTHDRRTGGYWSRDKTVYRQNICKIKI